MEATGARVKIPPTHSTLSQACLYWNDDASDPDGVVFLEDVKRWASQDDAYRCQSCGKFFSLSAQPNEGEHPCSPHALGSEDLCEPCAQIADDAHRQDRRYGSYDQQVAAQWRASR